MSQALVVHRVALHGEKRTYSWAFQTGLNVIVGPVGVGKTSLLELIKFGFGGNAVLTNTVEAVGDAVTLDVDLGEQRLRLRRRIGTGDRWVEVEGPDGVIATLPVDTKPGERGISEFLWQRSRKSPHF